MALDNLNLTSDECNTAPDNVLCSLDFSDPDFQAFLVNTWLAYHVDNTVTTAAASTLDMAPNNVPNTLNTSQLSIAQISDWMSMCESHTIWIVP